MQKVLEYAKTLDYQFLFHGPDHEKAFFNDINNEVLYIDGAVLFIEKSPLRMTLYPAFKDKMSFKKALGGLYRLYGEAEITIEVGEDKESEGLLNRMHTTFEEAGCMFKCENMVMRTKRLVGNRRTITDNVLPFKGDPQALYRLTTDLLDKETFNMDFDAFDAFLDDDTTIARCVTEGDVIKGFIYGVIYNEGKSVFIRGLGVHPDYRRMGISKKLMQGLFEEASKRHVHDSMLWVESSNTRAINLYKQFDFRPDGDKERHYIYRTR